MSPLTVSWPQLGHFTKSIKELQTTTSNSESESVLCFSMLRFWLLNKFQRNKDVLNETDSKYTRPWISIQPLSACFTWICMKFCVHVQFEFVVCIPCHNYCASLLWVKPLCDMPPPRALINQMSLERKTWSCTTRAKRIVWSACQIRGFVLFRVQLFLSSPLFKSHSSLISFSLSALDFRFLLQILFGNNEYISLNTWMN